MLTAILTLLYDDNLLRSVIKLESLLNALGPLCLWQCYFIFARWNIYQCKFNTINFPKMYDAEILICCFQTLLWTFWITTKCTTQAIWRKKLIIFHLKSIFQNWSLKCAPWWKRHLAKYPRGKENHFKCFMTKCSPEMKSQF